MEKYLTTKQIAKRFQVSEMTIFRWREQGMPFTRVGASARSIRFELVKVEQWMKERDELHVANK